MEADLRQRFDARRNPGKKVVDKHLAVAAAAVAQGDWAAAVNAMKLAVQAAPEDPAVLARQVAIQQQADRALAPRFLEQARYEEKDGHPDRAARSYERAALGKNSAELFEKSAKCLLKLGHLSETDKRKVVEMARKSVTLDNRIADYRLTLARAYDVAGMRTSAQGEVRRALELEPNNKDAKELQKALK
jgi:tetratricopeptide (TPR) repeat protein